MDIKKQTADITLTAVITILAMATAIFASDEQVAMTMCFSLLSINCFLSVVDIQTGKNEVLLSARAVKLAEIIFFDIVIIVAYLLLPVNTALGIMLLSLLNIIIHHVHNDKRATELSAVAVMVFDEVIGIMTVFAIASPETEAFFREWNKLLLLLIMMGFLYKRA